MYLIPFKRWLFKEYRLLLFVVYSVSVLFQWFGITCTSWTQLNQFYLGLHSMYWNFLLFFCSVKYSPFPFIYSVIQSFLSPVLLLFIPLVAFFISIAVIIYWSVFSSTIIFWNFSSNYFQRLFIVSSILFKYFIFVF